MENKKIALPTTILSLSGFLLNSIILFLPIYFTDIGFSGLQIGFLLSIFAITSLLSSAIAGFFSDRFQIKYLSAASFFLLVIYLFGLSKTVNFWVVAALFFLGGLGHNFSDITLTSFVLKNIRKRKSSEKIGFFNSVKTISSGIGALIGGLLLVKYQFKNIFLFIALCFMIIACITLFIKKIGTFNYKIKHYKGDLFKKEIIFFALLIFIFTLHWGAESTSYSLFLKNNLGLSQTSIALYIGTIWIFFGAMIFFVGKKIKNDSTLKKIIYISIFLSGAGHIFFTIPNLAASYIIRMLHEIGDAGFQMFLMLGIYRHFPSGRIGGTSGVILTVTILGKFLGSIIFGPIGEAFGYNWPFILSGLLTLLCIIVAYFYFKSCKSCSDDDYIDISELKNR